MVKAADSSWGKRKIPLFSALLNVLTCNVNKTEVQRAGFSYIALICQNLSLKW
jgi:hypothetical protein